jgi:hypothetical protein
VGDCRVPCLIVNKYNTKLSQQVAANDYIIANVPRQYPDRKLAIRWGDGDLRRRVFKINKLADFRSDRLLLGFRPWRARLAIPLDALLLIQDCVSSIVSTPVGVKELASSSVASIT